MVVWFGDKAPASRAALQALSTGGAHPVSSLGKAFWEKTHGKCCPRLHSHWKTPYICNKDSSVPVGSTRAGRAVSSDAGPYSPHTVGPEH